MIRISFREKISNDEHSEQKCDPFETRGDKMCMENLKLLDLAIDCGLNFDVHISNVYKKASFSVFPRYFRFLKVMLFSMAKMKYTNHPTSTHLAKKITLACYACLRF